MVRRKMPGWDVRFRVKVRSPSLFLSLVNIRDAVSIWSKFNRDLQKRHIMKRIFLSSWDKFSRCLA